MLSLSFNIFVMCTMLGGNFNCFIRILFIALYVLLSTPELYDLSENPSLIKAVATSLVQSRLDYANSLLYVLSESNLNKLQ